METFTEIFATATPVQFVMVGALVVLVWFLPALLALIFNRKQAKLIAIACVPAGFSLIAWSGVMIWAVTGNMLNRFNRKAVAE